MKNFLTVACCTALLAHLLSTAQAVVEAPQHEAAAAADTGPDCNGNGVEDAVDIASGYSVDLDGNGVPDECDAPRS